MCKLSRKTHSAICNYSFQTENRNKIVVGVKCSCQGLQRINEVRIKPKDFKDFKDGPVFIIKQL